MTTFLAQSLDDAGDCLMVEANHLVISMNCPLDAGEFDLSDLHADACDDIACAWLTGTLDVQAFTPECGYGCGLLEATLHLPPVFDGGGPFVSGTGSLSYYYANSSYTCTGPINND